MLEKIVLVPDHCLSFYFKMFHGIQIIAPVSGNCSKYLVSCEVCVKVSQTINEPSQKSRTKKKKKNAVMMDSARQAVNISLRATLTDVIPRDIVVAGIMSKTPTYYLVRVKHPETSQPKDRRKTTEN